MLPRTEHAACLERRQVRSHVGKRSWLRARRSARLEGALCWAPRALPRARRVRIQSEHRVPPLRAGCTLERLPEG